MSRSRASLLASVLGLTVLFSLSSGGPLLAGMKGPHEDSGPRSGGEGSNSIPTNPFLIVADGGIRFFQRVISPVDGPRSPSYPTGSAYGRRAIAEEGVFWGLLMTGDRLLHEADQPQGKTIRIHGKDRYFDLPAHNRFWRE